MTRTSKIVLVVAIVAAVGVAAIGAIGSVVVFNRSFDRLHFSYLPKKFSDQFLKTAVAHLELHRLRYGAYPDKLEDIEFLGEWDRGIFIYVAYYPNEEGTAYYIELNRKVFKETDVELPEAFWRGIGFSPELKPSNNADDSSPIPN